MGFYEEDVLSALTYMLRNRLITADHMGRARLVETDHVRAHAAGLAHWRFLASRLEYLVGVLPATYVTDRRLAEWISKRSKVNEGYTDISLARKKEVLHELINYLKDEFNRHAGESPFYENVATGGRLLIRHAEEAFNPVSKGRQPDWQGSSGRLL
jgi:hypothetical protein